MRVLICQGHQRTPVEPRLLVTARPAVLRTPQEVLHADSSPAPPPSPAPPVSRGIACFSRCTRRPSPPSEAMVSHDLLGPNGPGAAPGTPSRVTCEGAQPWGTRGKTSSRCPKALNGTRRSSSETAGQKPYAQRIVRKTTAQELNCHLQIRVISNSNNPPL